MESDRQTISMQKEPTAKSSLLPLTKEKKAIIRSTGNIKINAVAGSGKTTTVLEYARTRPAGSRILYLAFNKAVKLEAARKFSEMGLHQVKVETAHSLAYKHVVFKEGYTVRMQSYKIHEVADLAGVKRAGDKHSEFVIANHILKLVAYFCNSDKRKVQDLNYLDIVNDKKARAFVKSYYKQIEQGARIILAKMDKGTIEISHDFYLKKFQLQNPQLDYDYILFDEAQDASPAMLDVFLKQKATKVIVGDTHQQIYGWRFAVNSLEKADFKTYHLSTSFRFGQDIANLATSVLKWKAHLAEHKEVQISGKGKGEKTDQKATIARTNLGLLLKVIEFIKEHKDVKHIYFEGNIHSYTYADEGASLYDVLSLSNNNKDQIKDKLVRSMNDIGELEEYIEKTEDVQLAMMLEIVKKYGNEIPRIIRQIKEKHVSDEEKHKAEMIFSTVHRCKGMEYGTIQLVNDFTGEAKLQRLKSEHKEEEPFDVSKWNEEINLLYVAITRTKGSVKIPEQLMPKDFPDSPHVQLIKTKKQQVEADGKTLFVRSERANGKITSYAQEKAKAYSVEKIREVHKKANKPWTPEEDKELSIMYDQETGFDEMARHFGRMKSAIYSRLKKLGFIRANNS